MKKSGSIAILNLIPILFAFFIMGFADVVGISTSYVKADFGLNDTISNLLSMMVFVWFAICSIPTGIIMGQIGRKRTVLFSIALTILAMTCPLVVYSFPSILLGFTLLGISNTILQVSLNPLLADVIPAHKVTSMLTLGQFIKAISSALGPIIASAAVSLFGNWFLIFAVYAATSLISCLWLAFTHIEEKKIEVPSMTFSQVIRLLKEHKLMLSFSAIVLIVGFETSLITIVPKYFVETCNLPLDKGSLGCSIYFTARTIGTFIGTFILAHFSARKFLIGNIFLAILMLVSFMFVSNITILMVILFIIGFTGANVFPIIYSRAIQNKPERANEVSALMIMGIAGGAIFPMLAGILADLGNQWTSLFVPLFSLIYILWASIKSK